MLKPKNVKILTSTSEKITKNNHINCRFYYRTSRKPDNHGKIPSDCSYLDITIQRFRVLTRACGVKTFPDKWWVMSLCVYIHVHDPEERGDVAMVR